MVTLPRWWSPRWLALLALMLSPACSESSAPDGPDPHFEEQKTKLDSCGFPTPCPESLYGGEQAGSVINDCTVEELWHHRPMHATFFEMSGGGCGYEKRSELYVGSTGSVVRWSRGADGCGDNSFDYELLSCTLKPDGYFEQCAGTGNLPSTNTCGFLGNLVQGCTVVQSAACPGQ